MRILTLCLGLCALPLAVGLAQTCNEDVGAELATVYVEQCLDISPATHPPCNAENCCELIQNEIARGCAMIAEDAPEETPDYCAEYLVSGEEQWPRSPDGAKRNPGRAFDAADRRSQPTASRKFR